MALSPNPLDDIVSKLVFELFKQGASWLKEKTFGTEDEKALQRAWTSAFHIAFKSVDPNIDVNRTDRLQAAMKYFLESQGVADELLDASLSQRSPDVENFYHRFLASHPAPEAFPINFHLFLTSLFDSLGPEVEKEAKEISNLPLLVILGKQDQIRDRLPKSEPARRLTPPLDLPEPPLRFRNRKRELKKLHSLLAPGRVISVVGPGGTGKTDLVSHLLHSLAPDHALPAAFPDGMLFHSFYRQPSLDQALDAIVRAYDEEPKPTLMEAARRALRSRRALLFLDGAEEAENLSALLEIRDQCCLLITSRDKAHLIEEGFTLRPFSQRDGTALLASWGSDYARDETSCLRVCELVGGLPLALRIAGQYMRSAHTPAQDFAERLHKTPLQLLSLGKRRKDSLPILLAQSLTQVSETARQVMAVAGLLAYARFPSSLVAAALDNPEPEVQLALDELVRFGLLNRSQAGCQVSHPLLHTYTRQQIQPPNSTFHALSSFFLHLVKTETSKGSQGYVILDLFLPHILSTLIWLDEHGQFKTILTIVQSLQDYLDLRGRAIERVQVFELALTASHQQSDPDVGQWLNNLGEAYNDLGETGKSIEFYEKALFFYRKKGDLDGEGIALSNLGNAERALGNVLKSIEYHKKAILIFRKINDRRGEANSMGNLGVAYFLQGKIRNAIGNLKKALVISRETGNRHGEGGILGNLGVIYKNLGNHNLAIKCYKNQLAVALELGDRKGESNAIGNLGVIYYLQGNIKKAIASYKKQLDIAREIGDKYGESNALGNLGAAHADSGAYRQAIRFYNQQLVIVRKIGNRIGEGNSLANIGNAYYLLGDIQQALENNYLALNIFREIGDRCIIRGKAHSDSGVSRTPIPGHAAQ